MTKTYFVLAIYSLYDIFNGYSWCQAILASFFYCYWSGSVPSQMVVATAKLDDVIVISQNCATITCYSIAGVASPLPRLNLEEKKQRLIVSARSIIRNINAYIGLFFGIAAPLMTSFLSSYSTGFRR